MTRGKKKNGNGKYPGRPKRCEKIPDEGACLKQLRSLHPGICVNCHAEEIQSLRIKIFGK
jgi:hypothetical protein